MDWSWNWGCVGLVDGPQGFVAPPRSLLLCQLLLPARGRSRKARRRVAKPDASREGRGSLEALLTVTVKSGHLGARG